MQYRKKPLVIDAYQWFEGMLDTPGVRKIPAHAVDHVDENKRLNKAGEVLHRGIIHEAPDQYVVDALEGPLHVSPGDWIIRGVKGEYYPCKPDVFALTYEDAVAAIKAEHPILTVGEIWNDEKLVPLLQQLVVWGRSVQDRNVEKTKGVMMQAFLQCAVQAHDILMEKQKEGPYGMPNN